ncbi:DUF6801 domain-containing protein [Actinomadura sp. WMMB 499]|uniref:DUF6801 domain-containing protein n=1 Tax=Actinomadura sp. WMMB 499 TaxID=1219491 RepID=UPI001246EF12|nr:DUF6801 domain-containing protein [Actinomadura sp. WMMB 499]QFG23662.1 hypothetical protein F7P10_23600 [Actinomadura sp. WMMB 499]
MTRKRRTGRRGALCAAVAVAASGLVAGPAAAAPAAPATLELDYHCTFPLIGPQPVRVSLGADVPETVRVGEVMPGIAVESTATVGAASARALAALGTATLEGGARADANLTVPEMPGGLPVQVDVGLERTDVPASGEFTVRGSGTAPDLTFSRPGPGTVAVGNLVLTLTPRTADGGPGGLGTFESECVQDPGQDNVLASFEIVDATGGGGDHAYAAEGSTLLAAAGATVPLTGGMALALGGDGARADLALDPATANVSLFGFLPVTAELRLDDAGGGTAEFADGVLTTTSELTAAFPAFRAFGVVPIGGGADCRTSEPAELTLTSAPGFDPAAGGRLTGGYDLPPLAGCGVLTGLIGDAVTGPGNTAELTVTPVSTP